MTSMMRLMLSINELTATRNILLVVALYSVRRTLVSGLSSAASCERAREKVRDTRGDSSLSTWRACRAVEAKREVGNGTSMVLLRGKKEY